jgi:hypothetical protein
LLISAALTLPSLFVGFTHDDLLQRLLLEQRIPEFKAGASALYDFTPAPYRADAQRDLGVMPWFVDSELKLRFLRPLASLSLALDHVLFGRRALPAHVQSLFWLLLLTFVAHRLYLRWFSARAAWLSSLVFALSGAHAVPSAWLASRHTLLAAVLGSLALLSWIRFREDRFRAGAYLAPALLSASFLASESGLVTVVLLVGYEIGTRGLRRGILGSAAHWSLALAYLAAYAALGYGTRASSFYVSPFDSPLRYSSQAFYGVPALVVELLLGVPSAIASFVPGAQPVFVALGLLALALFAAALRALGSELSHGARRTLTWLSLATLLSLGALVGAAVTGRVLPLPLLGAAALVGNTLAAAWGKAFAPANGGAANKLWLVPIAFLCLLHFGLSPLTRVATAAQFRAFARAQQELAQKADLGGCEKRGSLYLLTGADPILALYTGLALRFYTPEKAGAERLRVLSMAPHPQRLTRVAQNAFELEVLEPPRKENPFEGLYLAPERPLSAGEHFRAGELSATVLAVASSVFTKVRFDFRGDLERDVCFLVWKGGELRHLRLPALAASTQVPHELGPMGM